MRKENDTVATTLLIDKKNKKRLEKESFQRKITQSEIVRNALELYFKHLDLMGKD